MQVLDKIDILNHGEIELWDVMGDDTSITDAARVSYADATKRSNDRSLIRYCLSHGHSSIFEQVSFKFKITCPIFVERQWFRHRTAKINSVSGRYSEYPEEYYQYELNGLPLQSEVNNQGSSDKRLDTDIERDLLLELNNNLKGSFNLYHKLLEAGVSKEIARSHLPVSTYTSFIWKMDLNNLFKFLKLRMDSHAQEEIRVYADAIYKMIKPYVPFACEAFEDYILNSVTFSRMEIAALKNIIADVAIDPSSLSKRELVEFNKKLVLLGVIE